VFPGFDPQALLAQAQAVQQQLAEAQAALADERLEGTSGGGLVVATVSGTGELLALQIDVEVVDPGDVDTLADLIVAAVRDGRERAERLAARQLGPFAAAAAGAGGTHGVDLGGLDLSAIFGGGQQPLAGPETPAGATPDRSQDPDAPDEPADGPGR
jgi:DNA-binding YbaB/EbfC family protein